MPRFAFQLQISSADYLQYYRGSVQQVVARCVDGKTVQFPAALLKPFVTSAGVRGSFVLHCDEAGKGAVIQRA